MILLFCYLFDFLAIWCVSRSNKKNLDRPIILITRSISAIFVRNKSPKLTFRFTSKRTKTTFLIFFFCINQICVFLISRSSKCFPRRECVILCKFHSAVSTTWKGGVECIYWLLFLLMMILKTSHFAPAKLSLKEITLWSRGPEITYRLTSKSLVHWWVLVN